MRILLTGASGFIGASFMLAAAARGFLLRPVFRRAEQCGPWRDAVVAHDLSRYSDWPRALSGVDAVVHLAARAHRPPSVQRAEAALNKQINVELPVRLFEEAALAGVAHFVFISSVGVHGRSTEGRAPFSKSDPFAPQGPYAETKAEAERRLAELARRAGPALTVIRPVLVYGPGAKGNFARLVDAVGRGTPLPLASVRNRRAFLAAENLTSLILHRLGAHPKGIEAFLAADDEQVSTPDLILRIGDALGKKPVLFPFPPALLRLALKAAGRGEMAESLLDSLEVDTQAAKRTGWRPAVSLEKGLVHALARRVPA